MKHQPKSEHFFTAAEKEKLSSAVHDAESRTIGEVVVMVVDSSDSYEDTGILGGVLGASSISLLLTIFFFHSLVLWFIPITLFFFLPCRLLFEKVAPLKTLLLRADRRDETVRERALRAFYEKGLYRTRENTGVLFFLSLLERKVWVLADRGIYQKIGQETLDQFAVKVSRGVKQGRACEALIEAIQDVGQLLSRHFPLKPGDTNELPDEIIMD